MNFSKAVFIFTAGLPTPLFQSPPFPANNALPQTSSNDATVDMQIASPPPPEL